GSLSSNVIFSIYEDAEGIFWIGTVSGKLYRVDPSAATGDSGQARSTPAPLAMSIRLQTNYIQGLYEDREGMIWAGCCAGALYRLDPETGAVLQHYAYDPDDPSSLNSTVTFTIYEDTEGMLWVGTAFGGLNRLDAATDTFTRYLHDENDPRSLAGDFVVPIYEDRGGTLWVGSYLDGGLSRYDRAEDRFTTFLDGMSLNALYEDSQGRFWVGTWGQGLLLFDRDSGTITTSFTTADGLPNNIIGDILEDDQGVLWIVTAAGLSRFDPTSLDMVNLTEADGFPNTLRNPEPDQFLKSRSGAFLLGGNRGVTIVMPDQITTNLHAPEVVVTGLQVLDEPLQEGWRSASARLAYHRNDLTFTYVGLHFAQPEKNRYAYQLEGYDREWRQVGTERTARYTSLEPGDYVFRVKAANGDGVWSETEASIQVIILPPWWRTTWAYLLYGLLFAAGVFAAARFQRQRLIRKEREKARERELEQAREIEQAHAELQQAHQHLKATQGQLIQSEKMASLGALTAGIAHEIKNPLNFVNNFAEVNEELLDEVEEELAENPDLRVADIAETLSMMKLNASKIHEQGQRADGIVQSMMQHASGGAGEREQTDVNALVEEYVNLAYHGKRAQTPAFNVEIVRDYDERVGRVLLVPQEVGRVLVNLLSNAFDAVHEKAVSSNGVYEPVVTISTRRKGDTVEICVCDNGPGVPETVREKIFEPFFTTKPTGSGTGLGLSLSYDIVTQGHGGTLTVDSTEGEGAIFVIMLPA
ncbi:MAG: two-component regulator propeller domain-containing protein, partial [Nitrospirales bacterium]